MQLIRYPEKFSAPPTAVAIGNFDGLHQGHRAVLDAARLEGLAPAVLTFEPHPRRLFTPDAPAFRLEPLAVKLARLRDLGVQYCFMPRFDAAFAALSARQFLDGVLGKQLNAHAVITGENFAFGKGRGGDVTMLKDWGAAHGVTVHTVPPLMIDGAVCSSSAVRRALEAGDMARAQHLLGRAYSLGGRVLHGDKRGRALGMPTVNIALAPGIKLPKLGIYAVWVKLGEAYVKGAASLGVRPTIGAQERPTLEVHLLDFNGDLYGQKLEVKFVQWLRGEEKFASLDDLKTAMQKDCEQARAALEGTL